MFACLIIAINLVATKQLRSVSLWVKSVRVCACFCVCMCVCSVSLIPFSLAIEVWHFRGNLLNCLLPLKSLHTTACVCVCVCVCEWVTKRETCINISFSFRLIYWCERCYCGSLPWQKGHQNNYFPLGKHLVSLSLWVSQMFYLSPFLLWKIWLYPFFFPPFLLNYKDGGKGIGLVWT